MEILKVNKKLRDELFLKPLLINLKALITRAFLVGITEIRVAQKRLQK